MITACNLTEEEEIELTSLSITSDVELQLFEEDLKDKTKKNCVVCTIFYVFFKFLLGKIL